MKTVKLIISILAFGMLLTGFVVLIQPYVQQFARNADTQRAIEGFESRISAAASEVSSGVSDDGADIPEDPTQGQQSSAETSDGGSQSGKVSEGEAEDKRIYPELYREMSEYNRRIFAQKQSDLKDAFSYASGGFAFSDSGLEDDMAGYITIEKMDVRLALYIGSSRENMSRGATVMYNTSAPIGGENTNCVIAAHRSAGFFGDIELLEEGDVIRIRNLWDELTYRVVKIIVIDPWDTDKIKIVPGRDMITLLTCHPYWDNTHRYIVYCERSDGKTALTDTGTSEASGGDTSEAAPAVSPLKKEELPGGMEYSSSSFVIRVDNILRMSGILLTFGFMLLFAVMGARSLHRRKQRRTPAAADNKTKNRED